jgi:hypothetical protein
MIHSAQVWSEVLMTLQLIMTLAPVNVVITSLPSPPPDDVAIRTLQIAEGTLVFSAIAAIVTIVGLIVAVRDFTLNLREATHRAEREARCPDLFLTWANNESNIDVESRSSPFGDLHHVRLPIRLRNGGPVPANNVTVFFTLPPSAKTLSEVQNARSMYGEWYANVRSFHDHGVFAHDVREANDDGTRDDDWNLGIIKQQHYLEFGGLIVWLPKGRTEFRYTISSNEGQFPLHDSVGVLSVAIADDSTREVCPQVQCGNS